jgi:hypothetical protein
VRIPFPERIPIDRAVVFATLLFIVQSLERTPLYFSASCVAFLLLATLAFNAAGGLTRASGAYVFFYALLVVIIGLCYKALLGEPADSNLTDPHTTIAVYVGGMAAMLAAVTVSRRFARKSGLLQNILKDENMYRSCVGCIVFGAAGQYLIGLLGNSGAKLISAFSQLNQLVPLAIVIGVMYEIRRSGGTRSVNAPVIFAISYYFFFFGLLGLSKQGMVVPFLCWLLPVCALRFRLSNVQVVACLTGAFILFQYLVPYSQYGRRYITGEPGTNDRFDIAVRLLSHPEDTRQRYKEVQEEETGGTYFNGPQGFWDRLQFISVDDGLINLTDQGGIFGLAPIRASFINAIPHVFYPNKPALNFGNLYAHEISRATGGMMVEEDVTTGISFSPTAEAYHMARWVGVLVAAPLIWFLLFLVFDSLFGDLRATPWGLLVLAQISHIAPEAALNGAIYFLTFGAAIYTFCALFATWVAPVFAVAVLGRNRIRAPQEISLGPVLTPRIPQ